MHSMARISVVFRCCFVAWLSIGLAVGPLVTTAAEVAGAATKTGWNACAVDKAPCIPPSHDGTSSITCLSGASCVPFIAIVQATPMFSLRRSLQVPIEPLARPEESELMPPFRPPIHRR